VLDWDEPRRSHMKHQSLVLHLKDRHNCSVLESLKPGEERDVLVIDPDQPTAKAVRVKAHRSFDGEDIRVPLPDGTTISRNYDELLKQIEEEKPEV
jgi:cytosine/adenosine deaminase-related metal-dependent hydrolase